MLQDVFLKKKLEATGAAKLRGKTIEETVSWSAGAEFV